MAVASLPKLKKEQRLWTYDEMVDELPESNQPTELWDGELIMSPAPSFFHQEIVFHFHRELHDWVKTHRLGKTVTAPMDMVLSQHRVTQPDVLFISNERRAII